MTRDEEEMLSRVFGITNIKFERERYDLESYGNMFMDNYFSDFNQRPIMTKQYYSVTIDSGFLRDLIKAANHDRSVNFGSVEKYGRPIDVLYDYLKQSYNEKKREKELHDKYPELDEIMKDYEVMKALIVKNNIVAAK